MNSWVVEEFLCGSERLGLPAFTPDQQFQRLAYGDVVVDNEDDWCEVQHRRSPHSWPSARVKLMLPAHDRVMTPHRLRKFYQRASHLCWGDTLQPLSSNRSRAKGDGAVLAGAATNVRFKVRESRKYAATGGWRIAPLKDGKPADEALLTTCFPCHEPVTARDSVFTHYATLMPRPIPSSNCFAPKSLV